MIEKDWCDKFPEPAEKVFDEYMDKLIADFISGNFNDKIVSRKIEKT